MTKRLEDAVTVVRGLPDDAQDAVAELMLLAISDDRPPEDIPAVHLDAVLEGLAQAERGEFVSEDRVTAVWERFNRR